MHDVVSLFSKKQAFNKEQLWLVKHSAEHESDAEAAAARSFYEDLDQLSPDIFELVFYGKRAGVNEGFDSVTCHQFDRVLSQRVQGSALRDEQMQRTRGDGHHTH